MATELLDRRVIVDASYLRACPANASTLRSLADRGARLVLIDNLVYELCSTDNRSQWPASQRKLMACADAIECWEHTGELLNYEMETNQPYGNPLCEDVTQRFQALLRLGDTYAPDALDVIVQRTCQQREGDSMPALFRACEAWAACLHDLETRLRHQRVDQVTGVCTNAVCNPETICRLAHGGSNPCFSGLIDETWIAWHHYKAILCAICEFLRQGSPRFEDLPQPAKHRWINRKHDLDYLIALSRADAIATAETTGEMFHFSRWMYGNSRTFITPQAI